ncbi:RNA polymerase sigma factor [Catenovulum adriaticum]|uniref:Sigma-70 family RNA polymerase sigma factor n=1 Tax=Catenovulum adriaticum TaxID=2984846 RepID=A0ABY7ARN3_9ALTE|nr:sigma-70 family RNA polymerase sigma factor [Catenovulum sp. TS8]WAJ72200.1 sigma-70 family RNA polymerase sigma factor [Catenovulum sp. TS8]
MTAVKANVQAGIQADSVDDINLINRVRNGEINAYSHLVKRYECSVRAALRVRLHDTSEAEDLAQESFILAYNKLNEFDESRPFGAWVRGIAINLLKNHIRKLKPVTIGSDTELELMINQHIDTHYTADNEVASVNALQDCMSKLTDKVKQLILEHYGEGFSIAEMTRKHGVRHSAMTMRMFRIRQKLRECIENNLKEYS